MMRTASRHTLPRLTVRFLTAWMMLGLAAAQTDPDVSASLTVNRSQLYTHETTMLVLTIRSRGVQLSRNLTVQGLASDALLTFGPFKELPIERSRDGSETIEVRRYRSEIKTQQAGQATLAPTLTVGIMRRRQHLIGSHWEEQRRQVPVTPVRLSILPIPVRGRPANYAGAVGQFQLATSASPTNVTVSDLVTVTTSISGSGYLGSQGVPILPAQKGFKPYAPRRIPGSGATLLQTTQIVIPLSTNATRIGRVSMSYFDPTQHRFVSTQTAPIALHFVRKTQTTSPPLTRRTSTNAVTGSQTAPPPAITSTPQGATRALSARHMTLITLQVVCVALGGSGLLYLVRNLVEIMRRRRRLRDGLIPVLALGLSLVAGVAALLLHRTIQAAQPDGRVARNETVRFAPSSGLAEGRRIKAGTPVYIEERWGPWVRIATPALAGWVPSEAIADTDSPTMDVKP